MMIFVNAFTGAGEKPLGALRTLLQLLNPFAPHLTEELWQIIGTGGCVADQIWPTFDPDALIEDELELIVQINGKLRDKLTVKRDASSQEIESAALASPKAQEWTAGKTIRKVVVVPGKLVNIVV
jgi:leucyl-tRNA synthetase